MDKVNNRIGIFGLGKLGQIIAHNLLSQNRHSIVGYDNDPDSLKSFATKGGKEKYSEELDEILFHEQYGAAKELPAAAVLLICSSVSPNYHEILRTRMDAVDRSDVFIMDCPVFIGTKAAGAPLTILASGTPETLQKGTPVVKTIAENVYNISGGPGSASKMNLVNLLLSGIHSAAAAEAVALATAAGLNVQEVYDIIVGPAAGDSKAFENQVPRMMSSNWTPDSTTIDEVVKDMSLVTCSARELLFPLPLSAIVEQMYILASARGYGKEHDASILRVFTPTSTRTTNDHSPVTRSENQSNPNGTPRPISQVGFIGLGAMGYGMATSLVRAGYSVTAFDVYLPCVDKFITAGDNAKGVTTASEAFSGSDLIVFMVQNAAQVEDILFGGEHAIDSVPDGATIMISSTCPSSYVKNLSKRLSALGRDIGLVDAPVSGGVARAASGELTFICSGDEKAISHISKPLLAMAGASRNVRPVRGGAGAASSVKMINQLLAGVHITAAAEAMAFASRLELDLKAGFDIVVKEAGWSWMFENRVPQILSWDWTPFSALTIFVKDMGIVTSEARRLGCFAPISSVAHTLYLEGAAKGLAKEADIGVYRLWPLSEKPSWVYMIACMRK